MPIPKSVNSKGPRDKYSRLICVGCCDRRIRCELPPGFEAPNPGEFRTVQTPCYRCKRLGIPCVVRQTILGRPSTENNPANTADVQHTSVGDSVSRIVIELPSRTASRAGPTRVLPEEQQSDSSAISWSTLRSSNGFSSGHAYSGHLGGNPLLLYTPQSIETVIIVRALDTLRYEKVENEWFRHLPAHVGHTQALDLSIKAIVAACAYSRGVSKLDSFDCYRTFSQALNAVQANIKQSHGQPNDDILASTALLAPFEGALRSHGISTRSHVEGLGAMLAARSATYPVTQLAREILDFYACESSIMACVQGVPSPFENVSPTYFANDSIGCSDSERAQLKSLANELFIRTPRLVMLVRALRYQTTPQRGLLLQAWALVKSLLSLQDPEAEQRLILNVRVELSNDTNFNSLGPQCLCFGFVRDYEALASYWQNRLFLLALERQLNGLSVPIDTQSDHPEEPRFPIQRPPTNEIDQHAVAVMMSLQYAGTLPLRKHDHLIAHAVVLLWGLKLDLPRSVSFAEDGKDFIPLSDLLLRMLNTALEGKPDLTAEDMDVAADIFAGGPLKGKFAELYGLQ